ncbi:MAG: Hint domain-containing protein [Pseudomonadota bacterium]
MFDLMDEAQQGIEIDYDNEFGVTRRSGLLHSTRVATRMGWREVEALTVGDEVLTFDNGMQKIAAVERVINWPDHKTCPDHAAPYEVPAGVLGNKERIWVLPNQLVVVESDLAEELTGDPFALIPVSALDGWQEIRRVAPRAPHLVVVLHFERDQVIYAGDGALVFAQAEGFMLDYVFGAADYEPLDGDQAKAVADDLRAKDLAKAA